jgi:two-component system response regulator CpxR
MKFASWFQTKPGDSGQRTPRISDRTTPVASLFPKAPDSVRVPMETAMSTKPRLLMIDDDRKLCRLVKDYLEPLGYEVAAEHTGPDGALRAVAEPWQAVILDLMLPGCDGFEVLKRIRAKSGVPVLMLTARGEEPDRIVGLELGADDYLPKTFSTRELLARLRAVTRRHVAAKAAPADTGCDEVVVGRLHLQPGSRTAALGDHPLTLTPVEFDILLSLARARGRIKSREQLIEEIRDRNFDVFDRSIDVHISSLRRKLGDDPKEPRFIKTVRSAGYMLIRPEGG